MLTRWRIIKGCLVSPLFQRAQPDIQDNMLNQFHQMMDFQGTTMAKFTKQKTIGVKSDFLPLGLQGQKYPSREGHKSWFSFIFSANPRHPKPPFLSLLELPNQIKIVKLSPSSSHFDCIINRNSFFPFLTKSKYSLQTTTSLPPRRRRKILQVLQGFSLGAFAFLPDLFPVDE
ncbi:hypothetical protein Pyn_00575 [Prunus yedoensis var. nudiflora]|uniref:Uncharacterized protein n=1 Tax=Prunus yedoensis var. nudiflora TaxID=2094558 RepID=A0A314ZNR6_PRUYE|nr:hypothetical protein Pyn_00575 [Prunus yedoensis var. nudiflora]